MKAILMSIRPQHVANILNGIKTLEIRKRFPRGYVGWVYIYCTKEKHYLVDRYVSVDNTGLQDYPYGYETVSKKPGWSYNGKVIARFWCDKVEEINFYASYNEDIRGYRLNNIYSTEKDLLEKSCLTQHELYSYLPRISPCGKAIHITKLEIFDKPKEISEFNAYCECGGMKCLHCKHHWTDDSAGYSIDKCSGKPLTRAPESYYYIEV